MSSKEIFVVAQCGNKVELVSGDFGDTPIGGCFGRDPKIIGPEPWKVIGLPTPEQQQLLRGLRTVMGMRNFEQLMRIFDIRVE